MKKTVVFLFVAALCLAVPATSVSADDGQTLYDQKCAMCHGKDGVAKKMAEGSGNFNDPAWQEKNSADAIVSVTTEGKGKMKPFKDKLTPEQLKMIADYVKTMK